MKIWRNLFGKNDKLHSDVIAVERKSLTEILQGGEIHTATLQNGWTGTLRYSKNIFGQVSLYGSLNAGTYTNGTVITTLSSEFHPPYYHSFVFYDSYNGRVATGLFVATDGRMIIRLPPWHIGDLVSARINTIYQT